MSTRKHLSYHQMWVANHDNNEEGTFTNWYTGQVGRHRLNLLLQQLSTKYGNIHQLVYWAGWTARSSWTIFYPNMPMSIFALLVIPNFNQFLPADGVCPMAHRSALWWGLPIQLHGVEGENKFPVSQSQNLVKFSWRWRIQEMKKPQVLVTALATKLVRWLGFFSSAHCSSLSWNITVPTLMTILAFQDANVLSTVRDRCSSEKSHH